MAEWVSTPAGRHLRGRVTANTAPEVALRKALHALGARFRLHAKLGPGCTADIVLPKRGIAVFVDGDFWHSCPVHGRQKPFAGPNAALWAAKIERTRERDRRSSQVAENGERRDRGGAGRARRQVAASRAIARDPRPVVARMLGLRNTRAASAEVRST